MSVSRFWFGLCLGILVLGVADCRRQPPPPPPTAAPTVAPTPPPSTPVRLDKIEDPTQAPDKDKEKNKTDGETKSEAFDPPTSWNQPRVLTELVKSCAFDPESLPEAERSKWLGQHEEGEPDSVLSCEASMEQSCVYDPCHDEQSSKCNPRCTSKCRSCGKTCAAKCETCKTPCQDDACRMACAKKCASCHESCVRKRDRCATGTCTEEYKKCRVKLRDDWEANGCADICSTYTDCRTACREKNEKSKRQKDCDKACPLPKGSNKCDIQLCRGDESMGIDPKTLD